MPNISDPIEAILSKRDDVSPGRSVLVGITGIDGSGKGYLSQKIVAALGVRGLKVAAINVDGWLNLPHKRFNSGNPAQYFYDHAIRFEEMLQQLILPLRDRRSHRLVADFAEETASEYREHLYRFEDIDIIVLEGIYLLKRAYRSHFDLCFWVDCSFETALERALLRGQEGLPPHETMRAYHTIYFAAQLIHFTRDNPRAAASAVIVNDPRLSRELF